MGESAVTKLLKKGAEASLYVGEWHGRHVVTKVRLPKKYRPEQLDLTIRRYRTVHEPQLMHEAKRAGVPTPTIFMVDVENSVIMMEFIEGKQVKQLLDNLLDSAKARALHEDRRVGRKSPFTWGNPRGSHNLKYDPSSFRQDLLC